MKNDMFFIKHMIKAIKNIEEYTLELTLEEFLKNKLVKDAVVRNLEVIGEATKKINDGFRNKHPEIPWKYMAAFRDRLIHHYFGIDYSLVWDVVKNKLPFVLADLKKLED